MPRDRWPELCNLYKSDDGLPVRDVGLWTEAKLFFWNRYIDITTRAMVGHPKWSGGLSYIDLYAGPGICRLRDTGRRIPGSTLIAAHAPKPFIAILAAERQPEYADALSRRLQNTPAAAVARVFAGDCNESVDRMIQHIPERSLTLGFIDPEAMNIDFATVEKLASCGQVDLLILFADRMDLVRNVDGYEKERPSVLDKMMGLHSRWRELYGQLINRTPEKLCRLFADEYMRQLQDRLGYRFFGEQVMKSGKKPLYRIIFASKNKKGLEFWDKVTQKDRGGQTELFEPEA